MDPVSVLMVGTGEYTTGYAGSGASQSDKRAGVVALTMFDLRRRGAVGRLALCGVNGPKLQSIRQHMQRVIGAAYPNSAFDLTCRTYPADDVVDARAYLAAMDGMERGDAVTIFTPDDTHFEIAMEAVRRGLHVLVTKPAVKTLAHHQELLAAARANGVLVMVEVHKRFDPIYSDARDRIKALGGFSYFYSYMSQPKLQLDTFRSWAGKSSDISYYLNSHHVDYLEWAIAGDARPELVVASAASGVARARLGVDVEDTITLTVTWRNLLVGGTGTAVHTASWVAPPSDVHSQQRFFYMGTGGEIAVDQAHRGYSTATDAGGYASVNPLFMRYTAREGCFVGQDGYGYRSIAAFVDAVSDIRAGRRTAADYDHTLPTLASTLLTTAVLEAGRRSLDHAGSPVRILYSDERACVPASLHVLAPTGATD